MKTVPLLDLKAQYSTLKGQIDNAVRAVVDSQAFVLGPTVEEFETEISSYLGAAHAIGCASGSDALTLSLAALGIGPGDEVVTTPFSFVSSTSCIYQAGARPAFADIDPDTFDIDPQSVRDALGRRTRALIPVHLFGQCAPMDELLQIASERNLRIVEDAAQTLGAVYHSQNRSARPLYAGTLGDLGCYSFFPSKNLGAFGDGGLIVTSDKELADRLSLLRVHGGRDMRAYREIGWNSRLDAIQAAVLRVKLPHLDRWSAGRAANADWYDRRFGESGLVQSGQLKLPARAPYSTHIFNQYTLRVARREELRDHLSKQGVGHAVYYPVPLHHQECFRELGYAKGAFPHAEKACDEVISLPVYPELTEPQMERVAEAVIGFYRL